MLPPGIYYEDKNFLDQVIEELVDKNVYPKGNNIIPYLTNNVKYVNYLPAIAVGNTVTVKVNGVAVATPVVTEASGLYFAEFQAPYGIFEVSSEAAGTGTRKQFFKSVNLYSLLYSLVNISGGYRADAVKVIANLYNRLRDDSGLLRGMADEDALQDNFGELYRFRQPQDWSFSKYAVALSGEYPSYTVPGFIASTLKGSTTGAIKDVVKSVTGYTLLDSDFTTLQQTWWKLSKTGYKWRLVGGVLTDMATAGPHYFLKKTPTVLSDPIAVFNSGKQKAFAILLNIVSDGFTVSSETVIKSTVSDTDKLQYAWLNPFVVPSLSRELFRHTDEFIVDDAGATLFPTFATFKAEAEEVYLNGEYISDDEYTRGGDNKSITITRTIAPGDLVAIVYFEEGPDAFYYTETVASDIIVTYGSPAKTIVLPSNALESSIRVFINGQLMPTPDYKFYHPDTIVINRSLYAGDNILIKYYSDATDDFIVDSRVFTAASSPQVFTLTNNVVYESVKMYINGIRQWSNAYTITGDKEITISDAIYALLVITDRVTFIYQRVLPDYGWNVRITQDINVYTQGQDFQVNYTTGEIIWLTGHDSPTDGLAYNVWYCYFPKEILEDLLFDVKPSNIRLILQFTTTNDEVFRPYFWNDVSNPSGDVIF